MKRTSTTKMKLKWKPTCLIAFALLLTIVLPAGASVMYTDLGHVINLGDGPYNVDMDNDGDFDIMLEILHDSVSFPLHAVGYRKDDEEAPLLAWSFDFAGYEWAKAFSDGEEIGSSETWANYGAPMLQYLDQYGEWGDMPENRGYLGMKFYSSSDENWHYSWVDVAIDIENYETTTVYGYAWESDPNTAILTGDTGSPVPIPRVRCG